MARFIELTADDASGSLVLFNVDHMIAVTPDGFTGTCKIMVNGVTFSVKENYDIIKNLLIPH